MKYFFTTRLGETRFQTADGALLCKDVPIARTGVQTYLPEEIDLEPGPDGLVHVYRTEDEVFSTETMASFEGVAVTLEHPEDGSGNIVFVNPTNFAELAHGHIQNVRRGTGDKSDLLIADVLVKRQEAIDRINTGLTDVSCGYDAQYKQLSPGKGKQYQITGNHLAVGIDRGRAGSRCAIGDSAPTIKKEKPVMSWLKKLATAIKTKDEDAINKLIDEAPEIPSDGMGSIPGHTININVPSQATALPAESRTTTDEDPDDENKTGDADVPEWATAILARLDKLEGKTTDEEPDETKTGDEDAEEDKKVTGDADFKRNIIADAEIICPGFQPNGDKGLKRQVLNHVQRTGDSDFVKSFGVQDFHKAPKATVDAVFTAAVQLGKVKNKVTPPPQSKHTTDGATAPKNLTPAQINELNRQFWNNRK
ncbi:bacteriophage protein [Klebsiella pneumoniae]|uniref:Bacteriophage protein n=1 Tax=Klebsiella pneumoniae TaxID=573 RepID=A0A2X3I6F5_KLEPN|nr:bacteriophage protein [Klebsiella pneumoniae]